MSRKEGRLMRWAALTVVALLVLAGCSRHKPPVGHWEGTYESSDTIIAAWLEIGKDGLVRVSAPDTTTIGPETTEAERQSIREEMVARLASGWNNVEPRKMDFDGDTFRKPGGFAPQMKWNAKKKQMTLVLYLGANPALDVPMRAVEEFSENPFAH
jgi:hypothetical protein